MCLEAIGDLVDRLDDHLLDALDSKSTEIRRGMDESERQALEKLEELHRGRTRAIASLSFRAGVAMGRGLAMHFSSEA